jgi:multimeric flavodoxin WrbA
MKIIVLNGSPKGPQSVTMQYVAYIARRFPDHELEVIHVAQRIQSIENDPDHLEKILDAVRSADGVLWAFPLYFLLVHANYKRFIEIVWGSKEGEAFRGRHAAALSTSINFYDTTAHSYIHAICDDLGMKYGGFYSANMQDLMNPKARKQLELFAQDFFDGIANGSSYPRSYRPLAYRSYDYRWTSPPRSVSTEGKRVVILTDARPHQRSLLAMTRRLKDDFEGKVTVQNLHDLSIKGGCMGCLRCGFDNQCVYQGKDEYIEFYNKILRPADILIFAGAVADRQLSWKWRQFFDRSFFNCHTPSLVNKQMAFIVSGPLSQLPELRLVYEAWMEIQQSNLVAFVSDETEDPTELEATLDSLAERLVRLSKADYIRPRTFLGKAGLKVFRDDLAGGLRIVFRADHKAYKRMGIYDFPQRNIVRMLLVRLGWFITGLPFIRKRFPKMIKDRMIRPYQRILRKAS